MPTVFRRPLAAAWLSLFAALCATASAALPKAEWRIEVKEDRDGSPHSQVDLIVDDAHAVHIVSPGGISKYAVLARENYAEHKVPANALCACASWWAGSGTDYYVVAAGEGRFDVFRRDLDEGGLHANYKKDHTITIRMTIKVRPSEAGEF